MDGIENIENTAEADKSANIDNEADKTGNMHGGAVGGAQGITNQDDILNPLHDALQVNQISHYLQPAGKTRFERTSDSTDIHEIQPIDWLMKSRAANAGYVTKAINLLNEAQNKGEDRDQVQYRIEKVRDSYTKLRFVCENIMKQYEIQKVDDSEKKIENVKYLEKYEELCLKAIQISEVYLMKLSQGKSNDDEISMASSKSSTSLRLEAARVKAQRAAKTVRFEGQ